MCIVCNVTIVEHAISCSTLVSRAALFVFLLTCHGALLTIVSMWLLSDVPCR